jgi:acyl-CoA synthetase (AMP-forming)/AMP-acid ligase II
LGIDEHVRLLGTLLAGFGIVGGIAALVALAVFGSPIVLIMDATQAGTAESLALPLYKIFGGILMVLALILALPCLATGIALRRFHPLSRDAAMVVCSLLLAAFPIGTLLGVYGYWVVLSPEIEPLFRQRN